MNSMGCTNAGSSECSVHIGGPGTRGFAGGCGRGEGCNGCGSHFEAVHERNLGIWPGWEQLMVPEPPRSLEESQEFGFVTFLHALECVALCVVKKPLTLPVVCLSLRGYMCNFHWLATTGKSSGNWLCKPFHWSALRVFYIATIYRILQFRPSAKTNLLKFKCWTLQLHSTSSKLQQRISIAMYAIAPTTNVRNDYLLFIKLHSSTGLLWRKFYATHVSAMSAFKERTNSNTTIKLYLMIILGDHTTVWKTQSPSHQSDLLHSRAKY